MQRMHPVFIMYWKPKMKTLQPGTVSRLQEKSLAAFHAALSLFRCDQYHSKGSCNLQLPFLCPASEEIPSFFVCWKSKAKTLQPEPGSRLQEKRSQCNLGCPDI